MNGPYKVIIHSAVAHTNPTDCFSWFFSTILQAPMLVGYDEFNINLIHVLSLVENIQLVIMLVFISRVYE